MQTIKELTDLLTLDQIDENIFIGQNFQAPWGRVFGGQVLAQSLHAAYQTVPEERIAHSMHGYFILGGDINIPIRYEVDEIRDGGSFTTRRVVALQNDKAIFNMSASFQIKQEGVDHQITMPEVPLPETLTNSFEQMEEVRLTSPIIYQRLKMFLPEVFEFKPTKKITSQLSKNHPPYSSIWVKTIQKIESDLRLQQCILAYMSDYNILTTATLPHREELNKKKTFYASLDHAIWFHREFNLQDWLLYTMDSPSASNSRGFARGSLFDKEGILVASVAQEGLMRQV
tara:strand:- start:1827 stop:2684 length:858 start_codon:yes stop_codon:yes gene_type:complete